MAAVAGTSFGPDAARGQAPRLAVVFGEDPEETLVRRLESAAGEAVEGIEISRNGRWDAESRLLAIETTLTNRGKAAVDVGPVAIGHWATGTGDADAARYKELTYRNDLWHGSTYWTGPDWTRVGRNWHHPGINTPSIRRFTAPRDGRATITGRVYKLDTNTGGGDGVRLTILHGTRTVWKAEIDGGDTKGVEPEVTLDLHTGDALRFVVHKRGRIFYDTTHWDPVVSYAKGPTLRASEGFSTSKQGEHGWSYEMQTDSRADKGLPQVVGFDRDLLLRKQTVDVGQPASLCGNDALPLWVVADGSDSSGIAVALCNAEPSPWRLHAEFDAKGALQLKVVVGDEKARVRVPPGGSLPLPKLIVAAYRGSWPEGMTRLREIADCRRNDPLWANLLKRLADERLPELDLWAMVQAEWQQEDGLADAPGEDDLYAKAVAKHLVATRRLLDDLRAGRPEEFLAEEEGELRELEAANDGALLSRKRLYG
ncbi:MAG: hypothetical protein HQ567_06085, partial [Candidatus Nealsonbacteria bacterium]|nr:hypothetical protein [Candidatus Nealsonbacteria bacterium]